MTAFSSNMLWEGSLALPVISGDDPQCSPQSVNHFESDERFGSMPRFKCRPTRSRRFSSDSDCTDSRLIQTVLIRTLIMIHRVQCSATDQAVRQLGVLFLWHGYCYLQYAKILVSLKSVKRMVRIEYARERPMATWMHKKDFPNTDCTQRNVRAP